jgi:glycosyltransferase involved in cell wall biosynthesis
MDSNVNDKPLITVLMPVYNCELYVLEAVNSILNQTYAHFEFLIIDDASIDNTVSIVKRQLDSRIQLIEKPINTGYTNSLNYGLKIAKGKYIARMDGDDVSFPERLAKQVAFLETHPETVLCGTNYKIIGNNKKISIPETDSAIKVALLKGNCICHPSVMFRKEVIDRFSIIYDTSKEPAEDYDMWVRLLSYGKLHNLEDVLLEYRLHTTQVSRKRVEEQKRTDVEMKFQLFNYLDLELNSSDINFLNKFFNEIEIVDFCDGKLFKAIQIKLSNSNLNCFFDPIGFKQYLIDMEADFVKKCIFNQNKYSPFIYINYLVAKYKWGIGLTFNQEVKLFVKSLIFKKIR